MILCTLLSSAILFPTLFQAQADPQPISLNQATIEVTAALRGIKQFPSVLPPASAKKLEDIVNRIDWTKEKLGKTAKMLSEPTVDATIKQSNIIWEAYALIYAAQDVKLRRPQLVDTMFNQIWPVASQAELDDFKKKIDAKRRKTGNNIGALSTPFWYDVVLITINEALMSKSWPWIYDSAKGKFTLAKVFIEDLSNPKHAPSSKVYFDWWNERETDNQWPNL